MFVTLLEIGQHLFVDAEFAKCMLLQYTNYHGAVTFKSYGVESES